MQGEVKRKYLDIHHTNFNKVLMYNINTKNQVLVGPHTNQYKEVLYGFSLLPDERISKHTGKVCNESFLLSRGLFSYSTNKGITFLIHVEASG